MVFKMTPLKILMFLTLIGLSYEILPSHYDDLTAADKIDVLWSQISQEPYSANALPQQNPSFFSMLSIFYPSFVKKTFTRISDEMPPGRQKLLHSHASVAKIELVITSNSSKYTGVFKSGGVGLARLSIVRHMEDQFIPAMGLKILIDGKPSVNFQVMNSLSGQGTNKNFFEKTFTNVIPDAKSWAEILLGKAFAFVIWLLPGGPEDRPESPTNLPVYEHAAIESSGQIVSTVYAPYVVEFIPNPDLGWSPNTKADFRVNLQRVPVGSLLYTVAVKRNMRATSEIIGKVVTTSPFVSSRYGDEALFFRHAKKAWKA